MFKQIFDGIDSIFARDPAARNRLEVLFCYPGVHAVAVFRVSHWLWALPVPGAKFLARLLGYLGRMVTGIEIHPGATIGKRLFIDHGFGVVIGETAVIGDDVTIYHDVTLGGMSPGTSAKGEQRHPRIGNGVIIGAGAQLLGPICIGENVHIGSNAVVISDVAPNTTVVGIPARPVSAPATHEKSRHFEAYGTPHDASADPVLAALQAMNARMESLQARVDELEGQQKGIEDTAKRWEG